ncbi:PREDICTED: trypsin 3A1-like [Eufriesea mexicana]|uniref:trypsin 3A1-like n=1 Tax=Eufriesea mexicana TaxID=516756 RepID=UPI00083C7F87|nr:PREDICTED: trypsin 3A1-like [Eufriesea mexicana]
MWRTLLTLSIVSLPLAMPAPQKKDCECVPYYRCKVQPLLEQGAGLINISVSNSCTDFLNICCDTSETIKDITIIPPPIVNYGCGRRYPNGVEFKITGDFDNKAQFGEFPWMVIILRKDQDKKFEFQCGGSLIHKQAVLTSASCVHRINPSKLKIRAGEWNRLSSNEPFPYQDRNVKNIIVHEKFNSRPSRYDFAILILSEPVNITLHVNVVCLPEQNTVFNNSSCYVSGWGTDELGGDIQTILKKIDVPIMPRDLCQDRLQSKKKDIVLHEGFICAGGEGKDTCMGDSGSPLVCPSKNDPGRYVQAGIVSWGIGCYLDRIPFVNADVAFARGWIDEQMTLHNLDNTSYQPST